MITETTYGKSDFIRAMKAITAEKPIFTRLILLLEDSHKVKKMLPEFEKFLKVWDLKVINQWKHELDGTIELAINARQISEIRWVTNLAYDFFNTSVLGHTKYP